MVDGRHFEQPLAMCQLEIADLEDYRGCLAQVDKADHKQDQRIVQLKCGADHDAAQKE